MGSKELRRSDPRKGQHMKLYTVSVGFEFVVVAEDGADAHRVARESIRDALGDVSSNDIDLFVTSGVTASGWDDECVPYGGDGNTRTGDYKRIST